MAIGKDAIATEDNEISFGHEAKEYTHKRNEVLANKIESSFNYQVIKTKTEITEVVSFKQYDTEYNEYKKTTSTPTIEGFVAWLKEDITETYTEGQYARLS